PSLPRRHRSSPNGPGRYRPVAPRRVVLASRAGGPCSRSTCSARSACPLRSASDRSARRRTHACAGLCTPRSTLWAVELRREKSRRRPQDRVRPAQLTHFLLQFDQALGLASRGSGTVSLVDLRLHDPIPQSLGIDPELLAHTTERARPRRCIPSRLNSHPRGSLPTLVRVLPRCCHAPHPPVDSEPPPDPGRFTVFCGYFLAATYQSGVLAGRIRASRRLTGAWWGLRRFCQSPNAPPLIRMKAPRPIRTVGNRICSQRSRTSAIGRRVATNLARPTSPATSTRNTMQ